MDFNNRIRTGPDQLWRNVPAFIHGSWQSCQHSLTRLRKCLPSRREDEKTFELRFFCRSRLMHHIFHVLTAELVCLTGGQHADSARGQRDGFNLFKTSALNLNIKAEPITLIKASSGIEADRSRNRTLKIVAGDSQNAFTNVLCPGIAAHQGIVEVLALKR